jgi:hypothetical protein
MAIVTNTFTTYDAKGIRESLSDIIYRISPEETPFFSNVGKSGVSNTYFEWQNDALGAAAANSAVEGDDIASYPAVTPTTRLGNAAQISRKLVIVSDTESESVDKAGRKSELAYQLALKSAELKRDMEFIAVQNQAANLGATGTARLTAGLESFLRTNSNGGTSYANATLSGTTNGYPNAAPTDGTQRAFTETILKTVAQNVWNGGGKLRMLMVGGTQKQTVSSFSGIAQQRRETGDKAAVIIGAADAYVSDFGTIMVVPNRFQRNRTAFLLDTEYLEVVFLRPFRQVSLAKTGDAEKRMLLSEWGLKVKHEAAHGKIADLT